MPVEINNNELFINSLSSTFDVIGFDHLKIGKNTVVLNNLPDAHIIGDNLIATMSGFTYVNNLTSRGVVFANTISANDISSITLTAKNFTAETFNSRVALEQLLPSNALSGQVAYYNGNTWIPQYTISRFPGTRLYDFRLTAYDTGFAVLTSDTAYCGVAPNIIDNPSINLNVWRISRLRFDDGGFPIETLVAANIPWSAREIRENYILVNN